MTAWQDILNEVSTHATALGLFDVTNPNTRTLSGSEVTAIADGLGNLPDIVPDATGPAHAVGAFGSLDGMTFTRAEVLRTATAPATLTQPYTVVALIQCDGVLTDGNHYAITDGRPGGSRGYMACRNSSNNPGFATWAGTFKSMGQYDNWSHILTTVYNGVNSKFYIDGMLVFEGNLGANSLTPLSVGDAQAGGQKFDGNIGLVVVYNGEPSAAELTSLHELIVASSNVMPVMKMSILDRSADLGMSTYMQGVAFDGTHYYTTDTANLYKWTRDAGSGVYTLVTSAGRGAVPPDLTQVNSIAINGGSLWVGGNNFPNTPAKSWVLEYNTSLVLQATHLLDEAHHGEGATWHDVGAGDELWVVFHDWPNVSRYSYSGGVFTKVADYALDLATGESDELYQGAVWLGDLFIANRHNNHTYTTADFYEWNGTGFTGVQRTPGPMPGCGQGIAWETEGSVLLFAERVDGGNAEQRIVRVSTGLVGAGAELVRAVGEALGLTGARARAMALARDRVETQGIAEAGVVARALARLRAEAVGLTETTASIIEALAEAVVRVVSEIIAMAETATRPRRLARIRAELVGIADAVARVGGFVSAAVPAITSRLRMRVEPSTRMNVPPARR
jgi:hypothetical protein